MYCLSTVYPLMYQKNAFFALVFTLRSKVNLILTRAIGPITAQSAQFSKIVKKMNIDSCQFFSHWKEALLLLKSWNKIWESPYSCLRQSCRKCAPHAFFSDFWERTGASFKMACMWKFRAKKRSAQASVHPLSQAQGELFCVLTVFDCLFVCHWESSD